MDALDELDDNEETPDSHAGNDSDTEDLDEDDGEVKDSPDKA